ncbi:plasma membrane protein 62D16 [Toxoplasma gondii CAST]|uniref:Plasma membrane protein 62D16 n=1 Tax=Toxoplasma gondii CAST TaxID=943122 RepID=A0A3R8BY91_TOXGO|nr:plasma membrane protein 62D16 [Toxoplasma gondii CAST]
MGCKQSVAFKETRKVAIERPSPLSFSSFSETPEKHSCRQVTVSQSEKDEQRQNLNRAVTLRGISTSEGLTASAESHEHESSAPPSLEARSKATTGTARSCFVSAKTFRRSGVNCSGEQKFSEQPPCETGASLCKFPNSRMSGCGTQAAFFGEVRHMPSFLGTVQMHNTGEQCHSETPGPENQAEEGGCCISRMQSNLDTDRVLSPHQKTCENPPVSTRSREEEPQNSKKEGCVARFQVNCAEVSCTNPDIDGAYPTQSTSRELKEFISLYYSAKQRPAADSWAVRKPGQLYRDLNRK